jgi:hypothetical protein
MVEIIWARAEQNVLKNALKTVRHIEIGLRYLITLSHAVILIAVQKINRTELF